jgi:hypothetical protein
VTGLLADSIADIRALRDSWGTVRGGWRAARRDAEQLIAHRQVLVATQAMTPDGMQVVLCTRLRLSGDTQTDILRIWFYKTKPELVDKTVQAHFQSVAEATGGFAAALGMERLTTRFAILAGTVWSAAATIRTLLEAEPASWLHIMLTQGWLMSGIAFASFGVLARWVLRWRLRARFRGGLTGRGATT